MNRNKNMTDISMEEPRYELDEDDNYVKITVPAPLSKPNTAAVVLEGNVLTFDSPPYLLKLKMPSKVMDDYSNVAFDEQKNIYTIRLKRDKNANNQLEDDEEKTDCLEDELLMFNQTRKTEDVVQEMEDQFYGFGNLYSKMFGEYYSEFYEIIDLPDPDKTNPQKRTKLRLKDEIEKFNVDHYLADFLEPDLDYPIENYYNYKPPWITTPVKGKLRKDEMETLEELPKKDWLKLGLADDVRKICELQMIDILFGYAYNKRIMEGDESVASAWNITKISSSLSWFENFTNIKEVVLTCYRRMITFPLCRNWRLADFVRNDVVNILKLGPKQLTRCLLEVRDIFNETENYYVLNTLFINDMCHFAYDFEPERALKLSEEVRTVKIERNEAYEDLHYLELAALAVACENRAEIHDQDLNLLTREFKNLKTKCTKTTEMPTDSESDEKDCTTSEDGTEATESSYDGHSNDEEENEVPDDENAGEDEESSDSGEGEGDDNESDESDEDDFEDEEDDEDEELQEAEEEEDTEDEEFNALCDDDDEEQKNENTDK